MPWTQNLPVLVYIELFVGTLKILNHRILTMNYFSTDKAYIQERKEICLFCQKDYLQIYYPQLLCPIQLLHVSLDVQVLVLIAWGSYICMRKKTHPWNF